ncbi:hypothetical protein [Undibacterium sp. Ren11W]|uniref:hypothetical protein n=1 Tax=Undibacterium sp. Ren11W TaxID=3413045 RepID=UPI003BF380DF
MEKIFYPGICHLPCSTVYETAIQTSPSDFNPLLLILIHQSEKGTNTDTLWIPDFIINSLMSHKFNGLRKDRIRYFYLPKSCPGKPTEIYEWVFSTFFNPTRFLFFHAKKQSFRHEYSSLINAQDFEMVASAFGIESM